MTSIIYGATVVNARMHDIVRYGIIGLNDSITNNILYGYASMMMSFLGYKINIAGFVR